MISLFIYQRLFFCLVSVNTTDTKDTQNNTMVPTTSPQLILQLDIIEPSLVVLANDTSYIIVEIRF